MTLNGARNWKKIAETFLDRTEVQCLHRWQKVRSRDLVSNRLPPPPPPPPQHGTDREATFRAGQVLNPELVKGPWTAEEDAKVVDLVSTHGAKKWSVIANCLPGRIGKQCRERYSAPALWSVMIDLNLHSSHLFDERDACSTGGTTT